MKHEPKKTETDETCIVPIEEVSIELSKSVEILREGLEEYYPRLLEEDLEEEVKLKAESLKRVSGNLAKMAREVYTMEDELRGRLRDAKHETHVLKCSA